MLIDKITPRWGKANYVPFTIDSTTLNVGIDSNRVSVDLEALQKDTSTTLYIVQDYDGTLLEGLDNGIAPALMAEIPPMKTKMVNTGIQNDKGEDTYQPEKIPVDVDNIYFTLYPLQYPLENDESRGA